MSRQPRSSDLAHGDACVGNSRRGVVGRLHWGPRYLLGGVFAVSVFLMFLAGEVATVSSQSVVPSAPTGLSGTLRDGDSVALDWADTSGATSYQLSYRHFHVSAWVDLPVTGVTVTMTGSQAVVSGLPSPVNYYFRVRASNSEGSSDWSGEALVTPAPTVGVDGCTIEAPPAPLARFDKYCSAGGVGVVGSEAVSDFAIKLAWNQIMNMLAAHPTVRQRMAQAGAHHQVTAASESPQSPRYTSTTRHSRAPEANLLCYLDSFPYNYSFLVHEFAHAIYDAGLPDAERQEVTAAYNAAMEAGLWENKYARNSDKEYWAEAVEAYFSGATRGINFNHEEMAEHDARIYEVLLRYLPANGWRVSCPHSSEAPPPPAKPPAPVNLRATTVTQTNVTLTWEVPPGEDGNVQRYHIVRSDDEVQSWWVVATIPADQTTFAVTGLTPDYPYSFAIEAGNGYRETIGPWKAVRTSPSVYRLSGETDIGPSPSVVDFEWNVTRDIEDLDSAHDKPSGHWSDGATLWILENGDGADDAVYAYDLATGERVEDREFELDDTNRAPRGVWSDRTLLWVSDSGRNSLFAHDLEAGERLPERDIALAARNRAARGIWSGDGTMWVLDGGKDALFAYDLASGALLAEYELVSANGDPHGIWSDGVTVWVSDHGAKRLFAYRLPVPDAEEVDGEDLELERVRDEEFPNTVLSRASNNSPRGLWSDGDVMYVVDASDGKVYTYNMPDAIDARLSSLTLSGVDIGEFASDQPEYEGIVDDDLTVTTVEAAAVQDDAVVVIDPPDADEAAEGRQVAVGGGAEITVTVTSADGSREKTYSVLVEETGPSATCLRGAIDEGFSLVVSEGGSIEDLVACAESRTVTALYTLDGGEYVSYILGAPATVNEGFDALYANGVPALTPLIAKSEGPPSPAPASDAVREFGPDCLRGEIVEGFNLVLSEGGSVGDLEACAEGVGLAALYALDDGIWVSYILGAPEPVNATFRELFADGLPVATPLVGKRG